MKCVGRVYILLAAALYAGASKVGAEGTLKEGEDIFKDSPSLFPYILKLIFFTVLICVLIYAFSKYMAMKTKAYNKSNLVVHIGRHMLNANKSVQIVVVGDVIYVLGVGDNVQIIDKITSSDDNYDYLINYLNTDNHSSHMSMSDWAHKFNKSSFSELLKKKMK